MKFTKPMTMYIACIYMENTKSDDRGILRYGNSRTYSFYDRRKAFQDGDKLVKEVYDRIMRGEISFPGIRNFNKNNVVLHRESERSIIVYEYNEPDLVNFEDDKVISEPLCFYNVERLDLYIYTHPNREDTEVIEYCENEGVAKHIFCRYGAFWYLIANVDECPIIVKKFWRFTKLDKMINYLFGKFENQAI